MTFNNQWVVGLWGLTSFNSQGGGGRTFNSNGFEEVGCCCFQ